MKVFILDTSVIVKWYSQLDERYTKQAFQILLDLKAGKIDVVIPTLALIELINVLLKSKSFKNEEIKTIIEHIFLLPIDLKEPMQEMLEQTVTIGNTFSLAAYDALFVAMAVYEKCILISDDAKGHGKITDGTVLMLKNYH